jgi:hypothetical protein
MLISLRAAARATTIAAALAFSASAHAGYAFSNDNGGDGALSGAFPSFTITGSDNGVDAGFDNIASYVQTFAVASSVTFDWSYQTLDEGGGAFDPGGYVLDGVETPLSGFGGPGDGNSGQTTVAVNAGDTFGWYVESLDSEFGAGVLTVNVEAVPEPSSAGLLTVAIGALAAFAGLSRRRPWLGRVTLRNSSARSVRPAR